jgi:uroporphyrinogen decarboxylase
MAKPILDVLAGRPASRTPIWLMRQAGRYLPEYRETRSKARDFLDLCYSPDLATEVTLQPLRRYDLDASILFADILLIPQALGQNLRFVEGEGPRLDPIKTGGDLALLAQEKCAERLAPVMETVRRLSKALPDHVALIGFAGAPWTVATYMVAGQGTDDQGPARMLAYRDPVLFGQLIDMLVIATADYLLDQVKAGIEIIQIFDTWAGTLPDAEFDKWVVAPTARLVEILRRQAPHIPIIGFGRGAGSKHGSYAKATGVDGISVETQLAPSAMADLARSGLVVQGNIDPLALVCGGSTLDQAVDNVMGPMKGLRHILNLGHGIVPQTPPDHVASLIARARQFDNRAD